MPTYNRRAWQQEVMKRPNHPTLLDPSKGLEAIQQGTALRTRRQALEQVVASGVATDETKVELAKAKLAERHFKENGKR